MKGTSDVALCFTKEEGCLEGFIDVDLGVVCIRVRAQHVMYSQQIKFSWSDIWLTLNTKIKENMSMTDHVNEFNSML